MSDNDISDNPEPLDSKTFSQKALNEVVQDRLRRQENKHERELEELIAQHATTLRELEAKVEEKDARLSETVSRAQQAAIGEAVARSAFDRGIRDVDAAVKLMNPALVEVTESGVNVEVAIDALLESKPYLREPMSRGSADRGARGSQASRGISRGDLEHMTHEQIIAAQDAGLLQHLGIGGQ